MVSLYLFTPFAGSIHQLPHHNPTPLLHSPLQCAKVPSAETLRMTAYQPIKQLRGCGIRLVLKPAQYLAPHSLERVRMRPPGVRLSRLFPVCLIRRTNLALLPQFGQPTEELLQTLTGRCTHRGGVLDRSKRRLHLTYRVQQRYKVEFYSTAPQSLLRLLTDVVTPEQAVAGSSRLLVSLPDCATVPTLVQQFE